jgi:hypothetical protein
MRAARDNPVAKVIVALMVAARSMTELETIEHQHAVRLARWSAALGTVGLITAVLGVGVPLALLAIACAMIALNHLASLRSEEARGVALVGLVAGVLALLVFPLLFATAVPRYISDREKGNHERCYLNLLALKRLPHPIDASDDAKHDPELKCPSGGKYRPVGTESWPRCSIPIHNQPPDQTQPPRRLRLS